MTWIKQNEELYIHDIAPFSLIKINGEWFVTDSRDQSKAVPYSDIFNNPVYNIDFSDKTLLAKHFRAEGVNTPGTPGFSFQGNINTGIYRISEDKIGFSASGVRQGEFGSGYGGFTGNIIQVRSSVWNTQITTTTTILTGHKLSFTPLYSNSRLLFLLSGQIANNGAGAWGFLKIRNNTDGIYVNSSSRGVYSSAGSIYVNGLVMDILTLSSLATKEYEIELLCSGNTGIYATYPATFIIMEIQS